MKNEKDTIFSKLGLKPLTRDNILFFYAPAHSVGSYALLAVNVMNPSLISRLGVQRDITTPLLAHTIFGTALYVYNRPHLQNLPAKKRLVYGVLGGSLFSLGSVLFWAIIRNALPKNNALPVVLGCASGILIGGAAYDYFQHVDSLAIKPASK